jgi:hypothetical protein
MSTLNERKFRWERTRFLLGSIGGTILFAIGLWQFTVAARNDFAKPVLKMQMELCVEASGLAALLAQPSSRAGTEWKSSETARNYLSLYYGKLGVVEDRCVYDAMVKFKTHLFDDVASRKSPNRLALTVAFACRRLISKNWSSGLVGLYDPLQLFDAFTDLEDFRNMTEDNEHCRLPG